MTDDPYLALSCFRAFNCFAVASLSIALAAMGTGAARGENWPGWRGPRGDGTSLEPQVPLRWSANDNLAWKTPLPGEGHSSPIVWGERIFLTTALKETQERVLLCLEASSGKLLWQETVLRAPLEDKNAENSYASATPATDGQRVYVTFLDGKDVVVAAHDFNGRQLWRVRPGQFQAVWGFSHNPMLFEDRVIVDCDSKGENFLVAVSCPDGRTLWKTPRQNGTHSYSAPLIRELAGRLQVVVAGDKAVTAYDPRSGRMLWVVDGPSEDCVATPVFNEAAGLVLSCSSWPKRVLIAIKPDGEGNVTRSKVAWSTAEGAPYVPSPISVGQWFMTSAFSDKAAYCFEAATGRILWREKMGLHHASPVAAHGLVYFLNDEGVMHVVKAGPQFELAARNELGEKTYASPAISGGRMFLRGFKNLYCIGPPAKP
ncbi:MAG TPA: PQQ-binding-like beta-propeller repeat protein [Dongiaceae bacterium]|nr:PQQ-binding-like beta-propeller repeat protein [Dongiaceae bacterium]